jgi:hypothetical protein
MPLNLPHWRTIQEYFCGSNKEGMWLRIHHHLRAEVRTKMHRKVQPPAAIIDLQSVKMTEVGGPMAMMEQRGVRNDKGTL